MTRLRSVLGLSIHIEFQHDIASLDGLSGLFANLLTGPTMSLKNVPAHGGRYSFQPFSAFGRTANRAKAWPMLRIAASAPEPNLIRHDADFGDR